MVREPISAKLPTIIEWNLPSDVCQMERITRIGKIMYNRKSLASIAPNKVDEVLMTIIELNHQEAAKATNVPVTTQFLA